MKLIINYMKQMMFICVLLYCGLPIDGMGYFRRSKPEAPQKEVVSEATIRARITDFIEEMRGVFYSDETNQKNRIGYLIQNIAPGFYNMQLSQDELNVLFDANTNIGRYLRKALMYTVSESRPEKSVAAKYFTDFTQYFNPAGRSYYVRFKEGEACAVFDRFLSAFVQLRAIRLTPEQRSKIPENQKAVLEDDFERFLTNISCPLTTSMNCFKNHVKQYEKDTTILTRFLNAAIIVYASAEIAQSDILRDYNKMSRMEKIAKRFKFWSKSNQPAKVPKDYIYAVMAPLSKLYPQDAWNRYITNTLTPFVLGLLAGQLSQTNATKVVNEIAMHAKDPSFLWKHWLKILGGVAVVGYGLILWYDRENLQKTETWGGTLKRAVTVPFEKSSYQAAGAGIRADVSRIPGSGYASSAYETVTSGAKNLWQKAPSVRGYLPNRPTWLGGQPVTQPVVTQTSTGTPIETQVTSTETPETVLPKVEETPAIIETPRGPLTTQQQMEESARRLQQPYQERQRFGDYTGGY